jgi:Xaa-Pro aminopeptidase
MSGKFGVRIEDILIVTKDGPGRLTQLSRSLREV